MIRKTIVAFAFILIAIRLNAGDDPCSIRNTAFKNSEYLNENNQYSR